jgi:hypothetical protein
MFPHSPISRLSVSTTIAALLAGCSSCGPPTEPGTPSKGTVIRKAFEFPEVTDPDPPDEGRPILSRAAAFVPADATFVVVFRSWREAVESLNLRSVLETPGGRAVLETGRIPGLPLADLPGLERFGMDVDQSLVVAVLPGDVVMAVAASRDPGALAAFVGQAGGAHGRAATPTTLQGREARVFETEAARVTTILHPAHLQVVISTLETPGEVIDNQLQAAFDGAPIWVQRARALPTPRTASVVLWTSGSGSALSPDTAPADASTTPFLSASEWTRHTTETAAALSITGDEVRLDLTSRIVDEPALRARFAESESPDRLMAMLPSGPSFAAGTRLSRNDLEGMAAVVDSLHPLRATRAHDTLGSALVAHLRGRAYTDGAQLRSVAFARYTGSAPPGATGGGSLLIVDAGLPAGAEPTVPDLLRSIGSAVGSPPPDVVADACKGLPCWRLLTPSITCAESAPLLVCAFGEAPIGAALELAREPHSIPARGAEDVALSRLHGEVAATQLPAEVPTTSAKRHAVVEALLAAAAQDVRTVTSTANVGAGLARVVVVLQGFGRPILPALLPRLGEAFAQVPPPLE